MVFIKLFPYLLRCHPRHGCARDHGCECVRGYAQLRRCVHWFRFDGLLYILVIRHASIAKDLVLGTIGSLHVTIYLRH